MMPIRLQSAIHRTRSQSPAALCSSVGAKPAKAPKKPTVKKNRSTTRVSVNHLPTIDDLRAAVAWCLEAIPAVDIAPWADALRPLSPDFREDRPEVAAMLADIRFPNVRRRSWSIACAILAKDADQRGDMVLFLLAGLEVANALRQALRGSHDNRHRAPSADALDAVIAEMQGGRGADALFDVIATGGADCVVEFDAGKDELVCQLDPDAETLTNVGRTEFARRVRRLR